MNIDIKTIGFDSTPELREHVAARLRFSVGRFEERVRQIVVRLSDLNGPRGGNDKRCQLMVCVDGRPSIVVNETEQDLYVAVDRAADRAGHTLMRGIKRLQQMHERRSASGEPT